MLNAEQIHHVGCRQDFVDVVGNGDTQLFKLARHQRAWADQRDAGAEFEQAEDIRPRDAAEKDVADNDDMQSGHTALSFPDRVKIQQRLGGMFVRAVARIDDARSEPFGEELRRAGRTVPQDDDVGMVRLENLGGVLERFAFCQA